MSRNYDEIKKRKILTVSFKFFREKGFKETSIKDIADSVGIATGSVYTYFPNKKSILKDTLDILVWQRIFNRFIYVNEKIGTEDNVDIPKILDDSVTYALKILKKTHNFICVIYENENRIKKIQENIATLAELMYPILLRYSNVEKKDGDILKVNTVIAGVVFLFSMKKEEDLDEFFDIAKNIVKKILI